LGYVLAKFLPSFVFLERKLGWMEVDGWNWRVFILYILFYNYIKLF
jgi:hypothetical protein